mgnify:CR=1 FL=1
MKALIVSDTHGSHRNLERVIEKEQPLDDSPWRCGRWRGLH